MFFILRGLFCLLFFFLFGLVVIAQPGSNLRQREVIVTGRTISIDSLSIIPSSVVAFDANGRSIDLELLNLNYVRATLCPRPPYLSLGDTIRITYRTFPIRFEQTYGLRNYSESLSPDTLLGRERPRSIRDSERGSVFGDGIRSSGSFNRGISFGNNQSLSVRSGMNIQLSGELAPNLFIEGAISDRDIPLQPSGNTVKFQEFDRIYLKVYSKQFAVRAGDIEVSSTQPTSPLRFARNVQGMAYNTHFASAGLSDSVMLEVAASVPKGKYTRNTIRPQSGNQGPYRLVGANSETFIIIIAGSERVYVDGNLVRRGEINEYTVDYNTAEITFTSLLPITQSSRIVVEFEYTERSYARYITNANVLGRKGVWRWGIGAFSERDSRNQPFDQQLTDEQKTYLASIGDDVSNAYVPQIDSVGFTPNIPLYERIDTLVGATVYTFYRHSINAQSAVYRVLFSNVGQGKGNYVPNFASANGRTFRWVAPVGGVPQGSFEPVKRLIAPRKQQMATASLGRQTIEGSGFNLSGAISRYDPNTFSALDSNNDLGYNFMGDFLQNLTLSDTTRTLTIGGSLLLSSSNFVLVDRIRPIEFEREWAIDKPLLGNGETHAGVWVNYSKKGASNTRLMAENLRAQGDYNGYHGALNGTLIRNKMHLHYGASLLSASDSATRRSLTRGNINTSRSFGPVKLGIGGELEQLQIKADTTQGHLEGSHLWYLARILVSTPDTLAERVMITYTIRNDLGYKHTTLVPREQTQVLMLKVASERPRTGIVNFHIGVNRYKPNAGWRPNAKPEENYLGRIEYSNQIKGNFITYATAYDLASGLEVSTEYYYIEVPAGQGVYAWNDYNGNGQQELNEFEIANFPDEARFVRVNFPGNKNIRVKTTAFSFRFAILPKAIIETQKGWLGSLARFSNQTSYIINQRNRFSDLLQYANPFAGSANDTLVTQSMQQFRNSLALNRGARKWGIEHIYTHSGGSQLQANGFEYRSSKAHRLSGWAELFPSYSLVFEAIHSTTSSVSQYFPSRNFRVNTYSPSLALRYGGTDEVSAELGFEWRNSTADAMGEHANAFTYFIKTSLSPSPSFIFNLNASLISSNFKGAANTPIGYEMLRGFLPGVNATWELLVRRRLSKTFELETGYFGRYLGNSRVVHTGSMQVRALF